MYFKFFGKKELKQLISFGLIGGCNTIFGSISMLFLYNYLGFGYWGTSVTVYIVGSIFSFFANKYLTFKSLNFSYMELIKFILNISICYFISYLLAILVVNFIVKTAGYNFSDEIIEQISMLSGMFLFTALNFIGQKLFVFKK